MLNYYALLDLSPDATQEQIASALKTRIAQCEKLVDYSDQKVALRAMEYLGLFLDAKKALLIAEGEPVQAEPVSNEITQIIAIPKQAKVEKNLTDVSPVLPEKTSPSLVESPRQSTQNQPSVEQTQPIKIRLSSKPPENQNPPVKPANSPKLDITLPTSQPQPSPIPNPMGKNGSQIIDTVQTQPVSKIPTTIDAVFSQEKTLISVKDNKPSPLNPARENAAAGMPPPPKVAKELPVTENQDRTTVLKMLLPLEENAIQVVRNSPETPAAMPDGYCKSCHFQNPPKTRYCQQCRTQLNKSCPKCNAVVSLSAVFCPDCGEDIAAHEKAIMVAQRRAQNSERIGQLKAKVIAEKANFEDWEDAFAGSFKNENGEVARMYARICASNPVPNLWWLWISLSIAFAIMTGLFLRLPADIAMYIGLGISLPAAISVLRFGGGCYASAAVWAVGGGIAAAVVAWGSQFMIGILCGLVGLPVIYLLGSYISESNNRKAIQELVYVERAKTRDKLVEYERELKTLME